MEAMQKARDGRHALHLFGAGVGWRSPFTSGTSLRAASAVAREYGFAECFCPCVYGWARYRTGLRRRVHCKNSSRRCAEYGVGKVASINGRYYAMDRDKRWGA